jgi:type 1 glutamine amidotransferase
VPAPSLLYVTQVAPYLDGPAGVHGVLDQSATAVAELAESAGYAFHRVPDVRSMDTDLLAQAAVVALFTIGETPWSPAQRATFVEGVRSGRTSVMAIHSATDSCHGWDDYGLLVGGRFAGHPWTCSFTVDVLEPTHPAVAHFGPTLSWQDEVYLFRDLRPDARILLAARADEFGPEEHPSDIALSTGADGTAGYPLSWCFTEGNGRVFSTSLGHFAHAWETPSYLRHLAGGLDWATTRGAED